MFGILKPSLKMCLWYLANTTSKYKDTLDCDYPSSKIFCNDNFKYFLNSLSDN